MSVEHQQETTVTAKRLVCGFNITTLQLVDASKQKDDYLLKYIWICTIVRGCMKGTATNPMYRSGTFEARVHSCTLGYMRVAKLLRFLLIELSTKTFLKRN